MLMLPCLTCLALLADEKKEAHARPPLSESKGSSWNVKHNSDKRRRNVFFPLLGNDGEEMSMVFGAEYKTEPLTSPATLSH